MKLLLLILFLSIFLIGAKFKDRIPYYSVAIIAHNMPRSLTNTCLVRAEYYYNYLKYQNVEARLVIGKHRSKMSEQHAWVEFKQDNKWYTVDLTDNPSTWGWENRYYPWLIPKDYYSDELPLNYYH